MENIQYNTLLNRLILPEYGRTIQLMVEHAVTIEDRAERNRCAYTIIDVMSNMFPSLKNVEDYEKKLWDHLAIISSFKLDVDYPFPVVTIEEVTTKPERMNYPQKNIRYLHYGNYLEEIINQYRKLETEEEKRQLLNLIIIQMKKSFSTWNKELMDEEKLAFDLKEYSNGEIVTSAEYIRKVIMENISAPAPNEPKKNKKQNQNQKKQKK